MRVLVTRPEPGASKTAAKLAALGHDPVVMPLSRIEAIGFAIPIGQFDAVLATSANAFAALSKPLPDAIRTLPLHVVGQQTALAAKAAGFSQCETIASDAAALVAALEATLPARSRLLYLCGKVRRPDLEISLGATGTEIIPVEVYDTISVSYTTEKMVSTLRAAPVDAVLVYSLEAAEALLHFLQWPTIAQAFEFAEYYCISERVGSVLQTVAATRVSIAKTPDEAAILALLV